MDNDAARLLIGRLLEKVPLRPPRFGLHNPDAYLMHRTDDVPEERVAMLQGKVWRQTKDGYVEVTFPAPAPYWADR